MDVGVPATPEPPGVHAEALRIKAFWSDVGRTLRALVLGNLTLLSAKLVKMLGKSIQRTETAVEVKRGDEVDQDTRPSSSSTDLDPRRCKLATMFVEKLAGWMDQDTSLRTPATSHPLDLDAEGNVKSCKIRASHP